MTRLFLRLRIKVDVTPATAVMLCAHNVTAISDRQLCGTQREWPQALCCISRCHLLLILLHSGSYSFTPQEHLGALAAAGGTELLLPSRTVSSSLEISQGSWPQVRSVDVTGSSPPI